MEDAHICEIIKGIVPTEPEIGLFGVFDGHGGPEVAQFAKRHFPNCLKNSPDFKKGSFEVALKSAFLAIDNLLRTPAGKAEVEQISAMVPRTPTTPKPEGDLALAIGCTACVALITKNEIFVSNAGRLRHYFLSKH